MSKRTVKRRRPEAARPVSPAPAEINAAPRGEKLTPISPVGIRANVKNFCASLKTRPVRFFVKWSIVAGLWLGLLLFAVVPVKYRAYTPGQANLVIGKSGIKTDIELDPLHLAGYVPNNIYTLTIFEHRRLTALQYVFAKATGSISTEKRPPASKRVISERDEERMHFLMHEQATTSSIVVAYRKAAAINPHVKVSYTARGVLVLAVHKAIPQEVAAGDIITSVDAVKITSREELKAALAGKTRATITYLRQGRNQTGQLVAGADGSFGLFVDDYARIDDHKTVPKYKVRASKTSGPSGGLMQALAIYYSLIKDNRCGGERIMGTGTIALDGSVGAIGGVPQKLATAALYGANLVFVPQENYPEAKALYDRHYANSFALVPVETFDQAVSIINAQFPAAPEGRND